MHRLLAKALVLMPLIGSTAFAGENPVKVGCAPDNLTVDIARAKGALSAAKITGKPGATATLAYGKKRLTLELPADGSPALDAASFRQSAETVSGETLGLSAVN